VRTREAAPDVNQEVIAVPDLYQQMDDLMALHGRVYQVFASGLEGNNFMGVAADLATALAATPEGGYVLEVDRGAGYRGAVDRIYEKARLFIRGRNARARALEDAYQQALEILQDVEEGGGSVG
jgi:hypothetical protein